MDSNRWAAARELFERVLDLDGPLREQQLTETCRGDAELESLVRELLAAHDLETGGLEPPVRQRLGAVAAMHELAGGQAEAGQLCAAPPTHLAGFRIVREIGSGGMGRVFEAEQDEPRRRVALKIMHRGLGSEHARRRFHLEAEILARLNHACIARVYAAGTHADDESDVRLPWFALELVPDSTNIVEFADREKLDLRARLELFIKVCAGVHFAHQRGVIHRDLKATNILVDAEGRPKIIDFGIARVTEDWDQELARLTFAGEVMGTLGAMSPEQLAASGGAEQDDIDTRTDVYSLGTLLFELITGKPSFDLHDSSLDQAIARVRNEGPRPPSELKPSLAPELDWIVLSAMHPDRDQRYSSVAEFAADVERHLAHEPVLAGPPTATYRAKKFIERNRTAVAAAASVLLLLIAALVWISSLYVEVDEQRDKAVEQATIANQQRDKARAINDFMGSTLFAADPAFDGPDVRVVDVLGRVFTTSATLFAQQPAVRAELLDTVGTIYTSLGELDAAERHFQASLALFRELGGPQSAEVFRVELHRGYNLIDGESDPAAAVGVLRKAYAGFSQTLGPEALETLRARINLGLALSWIGENKAAETHMRGAYDALVRLYPERQLERAHFSSLLGNFLQYSGRLDEAEELLSWAVEFQVAATGPGHPDALSLRNNYAGLLLTLARTDEALAIMEQVLADALASIGEGHPETARFATGLGQTLLGTGDFARARAVFEASVERCDQYHGKLSLLALDARLGLGTSLYYLGQQDEAERELSAVVDGFEATLGAADPRTQSARNNLAMILQRAGRHAVAEPLLRENLEQRRATSLGLNAELLGSINNLGLVLLELRRFDEALPLLVEALAGRRELLSESHPSTLNSMINLASVHQQLGDFAPAVSLLEEVLRLGPEVYGADSTLLETCRTRLAAMRAPGIDFANPL